MNKELIDSYCSTVTKALDTGMFKIFAHPDIYCWGYPVWDDDCERVAVEIIKCAIKNNVYLEINSNGIRNCKKRNKITKYIDRETGEEELCYSYPNKHFFKLANELGAKILLNDDAHSPLQIQDSATEEAFELAKELKINLQNDLFSIK